MVLDPRGEVDVGEGELEDCEKKKQERNSPNQTSREMENMVSTNNSEEGSRTDQSESEEKTFVTNLYCFMKERSTPIERIPHLGFKQINLWKIYKAVETLGGYDAVTARRLWKNVYDELGGSPGSTSAATCTRRHYERLVLPFERQLRGEEDKPLPPSKPRKQYKRSPENRGSKPESKKKRKMEREECEEKMGSDHHCERGMCSHHSPWLASSDRLDSDQSCAVSVHGPHPGTCSREISLLHTPTPTEVISPLEKKKRLAQASLTIPVSGALEDGAELERPSVIQLSHSSQSPVCPSSTRTRHSSDGSPLPFSSPSGSLSRSPSPCSVSSEDCIDVTTSPSKEPESKTPSRLSTLPMSKAASTGVCKPFGCYSSSKELANYHRYHYRDFLPGGPPHSEKTQRSLSPWTLDGKSTTRFVSYRLPSPAYTKPCWVPHASSFYKVSPRDPCRPVSLQPTFKPHMSYPQHLLKRPTTEESYLKIPVASPHRIMDRKEKAKTVLPLPTQQFLFHPHASLTMPYMPTSERPRADLTEQLKALPLQPVLLPSHLTIPPAQTHSMHCPPMGNPFTGSYQAALPSYPYPLPIWHPPTGYNMAGLQPY
ncbi:AT-rich interactive domain-containing protein 5A-like [Sinocyclocheilus grahami]|uniref:AT-rich interactive domain-containing protein 5A-like n=1 Tax=Sinocyclocheilus grahami TaxID=75366 RepID=A0A672RKJ5_SINGR|nr:PREDICTED: AT-rich interactive domain-containing protein 5A-like [Sinocyclocheilus grahami]